MRMDAGSCASSSSFWTLASVYWPGWWLWESPLSLDAGFNFPWLGGNGEARVMSPGWAGLGWTAGITQPEAAVPRSGNT